MSCSRLYLIFLFTLTSVNYTVPIDSDSMYNKLCSCNENCNALSSSNNLRAMLNFIRDSPEFRPLKLSVIVPRYKSNLVDFLLKYIGENSIETYTVDAADLSSRSAWKDQTNLTWTFFVRDLYHLDLLIYWHQEIWKACNQYLIIFTGKGITVPWRDVFKSLWKKYRIYRAVIVSVQDEFRCLLKYMPFEVRRNKFGTVRKVCLKEISSRNSEQESSKLSQRPKNSYEISFIDDNTKLFENFRNLNGYPINVMVFESLLMDVFYDDHNNLKLDKVDAKVVFALEKAMGANFRIKAMRKIDNKGQDPFDTSLRNIENGNVEMVITGFFVKPYSTFSKFSFTTAIYEDKLCFVSPDSGLVPKTYMPFMPFEKSLWLLLIAYNIVISLIWCAVQYTDDSLRDQTAANVSANATRQIDYSDSGRLFKAFLKNRSQDRHGTTNRSLIDKCFSSWLGSTRRWFSRRNSNSMVAEPPQVPRFLLNFFHFLELLCYPFQSTKTAAQKALLIGTLFFGMIMNGVYQSCLVSSLSKPFHYPQLHTLEDVVDSRKTLITKYSNLKSVFIQESSIDRKLEQLIVIVNTTKSTKHMVAFENKIAITRYYSMVLGDYAYYDKEGNPLLYVVDESPMNYRVSYVLGQYSPYGERVNFILLRLKEAGMVNFWFDNVIHPLVVVKSKQQEELKSRTIKLTLDHYSLTFLLLLLGLLASALMFFAELYVAGRANERGVET